MPAVKPPVRIRPSEAKASRIAAAIVIRRTPSDRCRVSAAQATKASATIGMTRMGYSIPMAPVVIEMSCTSGPARNPTATRPSARRRSTHGARLNSSHHRRTRMLARRAPRKEKSATFSAMSASKSRGAIWGVT